MGDTNPTNAEPLYIQYKVPDDETAFRPSWPRLSCRVMNEVLLEGTKLQFGNRRDQPGDTHDWEISSVNNQHRLAFNRVGGVSLDLSVKGHMRFLTGDPAQNPSERLRILANGYVGIGESIPEDKLHVSGGNMRLDNNRGFFIEDTAGAAKRVLFADPSNILHLGSGGGGGFGRIDFDLGNEGTVMTLSGRHAGIGTVAPENSEGWSRVLDLLGVQHAKLSVRTNSIDARIMARESGWWGAPAGMVVGTKGNHPLSLATNAAVRLTILTNGDVNIGTPTLKAKLVVNGPLDVTGNAIANNVFLGDVGHTEKFAGFSHKNMADKNSYALLQKEDGLMTQINTKSGGEIQFCANNQPKVTINSFGDLEVSGDLSLPNSDDGIARFSKQRYATDPPLLHNNVKLIMADVSGGGELEYEFAIGHVYLNPEFGKKFVKTFSVTPNGHAYFAEGAGCYVVDRFVNQVGDTLEQGDVVIISKRESSIYSGADNNIPLIEVDLATKAYDTGVCGIVAGAVAEQDLPFVETLHEAQVSPVAPPLPECAVVKSGERSPYEKQFAAPAGSVHDRRRVQDQRMGTMVTLGAYAHCKVDADIAPIEAGDLLTTSPTRGHAQKTLDPAKAVGAIIGKALGSLKKGRGKIPVLVMLQ